MGVISERRGKSEGKIFQDKIQACRHITSVFMLLCVLNLNYN